MTKLFPLVIIILNVGAALMYLFSQDYRHGIYWCASAVLLTTVTF